MPNISNPDHDKVVGFEKQEDEIIKHLINNRSKEREVVLVTGMGGLGKTTLVKRVYDEKNVAQHFDKRAWCTVSQEYDYKDLLSKIFNQVHGNNKKMDSSGNDKKMDSIESEVLRKSLMGWRYLIVLDDIWSLEAWEELNRVFPSCDNGSRIVLTSRQASVVSDAKHIIHLPFFTFDESWELLQMKLFKGKECPEELENVGREISKKCKGLPLTIGLIVGLLEKVERSEQMWRQFLLTLNSGIIFGDGLRSNDAIELSYKDLSDHLKPCLLYFAAFAEDEEIGVGKLIQLWISEGFIDVIEKGRVEDEAEDYLNHLVRSHLIMVSRKKYNGRILSCKVHDLIRDFCLTKAREKKFLVVINMEKEWYPTLECNPHRICFEKYGHFDFTSELVPRNSSIHTVLAIQNYHYGKLCSWIVESFKHLTILDLEAIPVFQTFLFEVNSLIHLRYLALYLIEGGDVSPFSLMKLECLITLKLISDDVHLPMYFWNMKSLRQMINRGKFIVAGCRKCMEQPRSVIDETIPCSEDLRTWILPCPLTTTHQHLLRNFPYLKKLWCGASKYPFPEIDFLCHLEYLRLYSRWNFKPHLLHHLKLNKFPSSIKEIKLEYITVSVSAISIIAELPNLEDLTLEYCEFEEGVEWNVKEDTQFHKLKYLYLKLRGIKIWNASSESFHRLENLYLEGFMELQEVPSSFGDVLTLKLIHVVGCNPNVDSSVKKILEYARDMGNEQLDVYILEDDYAYDSGDYDIE